MIRLRAAVALRRNGLHLACKILLVLGARQASRRLFDRLLALVPDDPQALASRAHLRAEAGDPEGAVADYRQLLALHPVQGGPTPWFNLGYLLEAGGRPSEAEAAFRRAIELDARFDRAWYGLGLVLAAQGRTEEAMAALRRNIELQPWSPHGFEQLVRLHLLRQEQEQALRLLRQLRGFEPEVARRLEGQTGLRT